jgi:hypothetical protein
MSDSKDLELSEEEEEEEEQEVEEEQEEDEEEEEEEDGDDDEEEEAEEEENEEGHVSDAESSAQSGKGEKNTAVRGKLLKEAQEYKEKLEKRGVIYMSRVPPFMKPNKARNIFEQYGEVTRLYLAEEGEASRRWPAMLTYLIIAYYLHYPTASMQRQKRKENGGNGSKQFCEGEALCRLSPTVARESESVN